MKKTMTAHDIANELLADEFAGWTRAGAFALADHLLKLEEETGVEMEFDRVAIRCDFSEYKTAHDLAEAYDIVVDEGVFEDDAVREYCEGRTTLLEIPGGGYIIAAF